MGPTPAGKSTNGAFTVTSIARQRVAECDFMASVSNPLKADARRMYSQNEDDGILEGIFRRLEIAGGFCVDVGAHDGLYMSNTANLIRHHSWSGVLIECSRSRFRTLVKNMNGIDRVACVNTCVALSGADTLDNILDRARAPVDVDLLSIDVDGLDYHVWDSLCRHRPKVVIVEYNPSIPNAVRYVQPRHREASHGSSARSLTELGTQKGYVLVYVTETNVILVLEELLPRLGMAITPLETLRDDRALTTYLFQGFDGTLLIDGPKELYWQHLPLDIERMQVVPGFIRRYPGAIPLWLRPIRYLWMTLYLMRRRAHWPILRDKIVRKVTRTPLPPRSF
jgi:hypothetical protein